MKKLLYISFLLIVNCSLLTVNCYSQPSITWQRTYEDGENFHNIGFDICYSTPNTYFVIGNRDSYPLNRSQIIRIDDYGDTLWNHVNTATQNQPRSCVYTGNGTCVIVGWGNNSRTKIDSTGAVIWYIPYDTMEAELFDVIRKPDETIISCGSALDPVNGYVIKFNSLGNKIWDKFYNSGELLRYYTITEAYDNGYLLGGYEYDGTNFHSNAILVRIDSLGNELWRKVLSVPLSSGSINSLRKYKNGYLAICGEGTRAKLIRLDLNGEIVLERYIDHPLGIYGGNPSYIYGELYSSDKIVMYRNYSRSNGVIFSILDKFDSSFNRLDSLHIEFSNAAVYMRSVLPLPNGDLIFVGEINNGNITRTNVYAVRTDSNLRSPPILIQNHSNEIPTETRLLQNYPNPFNPSTKIKFELPSGGLTQLKIYDILGREILILVNEDLSSGIYEVEFDGSKVASGMYFYSLETKDFKEVKKMVLMK